MLIKSILKKTASCLITASVILQTAAFLPSLLAIKARAATSANGTSISTLGKVNIELKQLLTDNADGTFTLQLDLKSTYAANDGSIKESSSQNGYYYVRHDGTYLLQLWGGDGASVGGGGTGGGGGYVYGTIDLKEGDILYYRLGGNGVPVVNVYENKGGANGGAGHGSQGSSTVGGGGGYSAFFLFTKESGDAERFISEYLNDNGELSVSKISEADRTSKHIMIAGGGGGGGAAADDGWFSNIIGGNTQLADGGTAGVLTSTSIAVTGGTVFSGSDGKSSGNSTSYVGRGGTAQPGTPSDSLLGVDESKTANNWEGTNNTALEGGAGGSSEWRGGAGGAGYCGGSGGIMTSFLSATNVGGGGGGSSYVSSQIAYSGFDALYAGNHTKIEKIDTLLEHAESGSKTGGAMRLVYLDTDDLSYLNNLTFNGEISKYFDVSVVTPTNGVTLNTTTNYKTSTYTLSGINLNPGDEVESQTVTITLKLTPKAGFMGGNNVPVVTQDYGLKTDGDESCTLDAQTVASNANVPLAFTIVDTGDIEYKNEAIPVSSLYTDSYADIRNNLRSDPAYDFIESIGEYTVTDMANATPADPIQNLNATTIYQVKYTVTPKMDSVARVGSIVRTATYSDLVTILVDGSETVTLYPDKAYESTLTYRKSLKYENNQYILSLFLSSTATGSGVTSGSEELPEDAGQSFTSSGTGTFTAKYDGYYYIQVWGASGGTGGTYATYGSITAPLGGSGGYVSGYIYLKANDELNIVIGESGNDGNYVKETAYGGNGGKYSSVTYNGNALLIAVGGGGGSGAANTSLCGNNPGTIGSSGIISEFEVTETTPSNSLSADLTKYNGSAGANISSNSGQATPTAASAGVNNYKNDVLMDDKVENNIGITLLDENKNFKSSDELIGFGTTKLDGAVIITPVQVTMVSPEAVAAETAAKIGNYTLSADITKYFEIQSFVYTDFNDATANGNDSISFADNVLSVNALNPTVTENTADIAHILASTQFQIDLYLTPADGFLGGNDVPVLDSPITFSHTVTPTGRTADTAIGTMEARTDTDYANVAIAFDPSTVGLTTYDKTVVAGTVVSMDDLFDLTTAPTLPDGDADAWKADYVDLFFSYDGTAADPNTQAGLEAATVSPTVTTTYNIQIGIAPKYSGTKAVVVDAQAASLAESDATVYVLDEGLPVEYDLTNLTHGHAPDENGNYIADAISNFTVTLSPETGYVLPDTVEITYTASGEALPSQAYSYNFSSGKITILATYMNAAITIRAAGILEPHYIHFQWEDENGNAHSETLDTLFEMGDELNAITLYNLLKSESGFDYTTAEKTGYTFTWDWGDGSQTPPETMPAADLWVTGRFVANKYDITVNYVYENGTEASATVTESYTYGTVYNIVSPTISGYRADTAVVSGTAESDLKITVTYTAITGQVIIHYLYADGTQAAETYTGTFDANKTYSIDSPVLSGYTPDQATVSGTMDANATGIAVNVTYTANTYTVSFDTNGGNGTLTDKTVQYGMTYGYDAATGTYTGLPTGTQVNRPGYTFLGWSTDANTTTPNVTESTVVTATANHTLYAVWEASEFTVTVQFLLEDGTEIAPSETQTGTVTDTYGFKLPTLSEADADGYTVTITNGSLQPDGVTITGTFERNMTILVRYTAKSFNLEVQYITENGTVLGTSGTIPVKYKATYTHTPPAELTGTDNTVLIPNLAKVTGTMPAKDHTVTVTYYPKDDEVVIKVTVSWTTLSFTLTPGDWNAQTHSYGETKVEAAENKITLTNESTLNDNPLAVTATLSYQPSNVNYSDLAVWFEQNGTPVTELTLAGNTGASVTLTGTWSGTDPPPAATDTIVGTVRITITRSGGT